MSGANPLKTETHMDFLKQTKIYPYYTKFAFFWLPHLKQGPKKLLKTREN
jgi:hypothetical protein